MGVVRAVTVLSTGTVDIHPEHAYGSWKPTTWWILTSRRWLTRRPINVYVIEHTDGLVLFDTGQDRASVTDPTYFPGGATGLLYARLARFDIGAGQTLDAQLRSLGYSTSDVRLAVLSHLHQDHIGGLASLPDAEIVVSESEWRSLDAPFPEVRGLLRRHILLPGLSWRRIRFQRGGAPAPFEAAHDLMGDGTLLLLPTPGHTPGSMSLLVSVPDGPPLLLVGDLTYDSERMAEDVIPGVGSKGALRESTSRVLALRRGFPGMPILAAHDPHAARQLHRATSGRGPRPAEREHLDAPGAPTPGV